MRLPSFQQDCEYDSVDIRSKLGVTEMRKHGVFCGQSLPNLITSEGNSLRIEFNSDNSVQKSGFAAVFFTGLCVCLFIRDVCVALGRVYGGHKINGQNLYYFNPHISF